MSTATIATILLLGVFLVLVFLRVPVVYAIGVASLLDFFYLGIQPWQSLPHWCTVLSDPLLPDPDHAEPYRYGDFCSHRDSGLQEHGRRLHRPSAAGRLCLLHRFHDPDGNAYRSYGYGHRRL